MVLGRSQLKFENMHLRRAERGDMVFVPVGARVRAWMMRIAGMIESWLSER